jgi:hypothetical protein
MTSESGIFKISCLEGEAVFGQLHGIGSDVEAGQITQPGFRRPDPNYGRPLGKAKPPTVTLSHPSSNSPDTSWIWNWRARARSGVGTYVTVTLGVYEAGADPARPATVSYELVNAFPTEALVGEKTGASAMFVTLVTLQCDEIVMRA